jgi:hypothetical protein
MPFPDIKYCIVCETVRREHGNKLSILGFYGLAPDVEVILAEWGKSIMLSFVFAASSETGTFPFTPSVLNPDGSPLIEGGSPTEVKVPEAGHGERLIFGLAFLPITFTQEGTHILRLVSNDKTTYETTFVARARRPDDPPLN